MGSVGEDQPQQRTPLGRVLVVDDEQQMVRSVSRYLADAGFETVGCNAAGPALERIRKEHDAFDVVLLDLHLGGESGIDVLAEIRAESPAIPVVMMTGSTALSSAVEAMRQGAFDYLQKPFEPIQVLAAAVHRALEHKRLLDRNRFLERRLELADRFQGLVGKSKAMRQVFALVESVAPADTTVLVLGESGTGKELVARAIHERSRRSAKPFVAVNCGALTETVLESELFGHVKGAFTGAFSSRRGLFEEAQGGTLLLDEVGELPMGMQVRLLRVLQEREVKPVGSNDSRKVDVRIIAATNKNLARAARAGTFRQDLLYRLDVVSVEVPPLRQRPEDVAPLTQHFVQKHAQRLGLPQAPLGLDVVEHLSAYGWPGNVRELENAVERAVVLAKGLPITSELLPPSIRGLAVQASLRPAPAGLDRPLHEAKDAFERGYLEHALARAGGNLTEAARLSGLDRSNFRRLVKRHGLTGDS